MVIYGSFELIFGSEGVGMGERVEGAACYNVTKITNFPYI